MRAARPHPSAVPAAGGASRRAVLGAGAAWLALARPVAAQPAPALAAPPTGALTPPRAVPALPVQLADSGSTLLPALLQGRVTAVQLMFTTCSSTCPAQGAAFGALASRLKGPGWQLLSLSIDALGDTPQRLNAWRQPFGAHPQWRLGVPAPVDVEHLREFFQGGAGRAGTHSAQVLLVDGRARLAWRSGDNPALAEVVAAMNLIVHQG